MYSKLILHNVKNYSVYNIFKKDLVWGVLCRQISDTQYYSESNVC